MLKRAGRCAYKTLESPVHMALVGETGLRSNVREAVAIFSDQAASGLNAKMLQIFAGSAPRIPAKDASGVHGMNVGCFGQVFDPQWPAEAIVQLFPHDAPAQWLID